MRFKEWLRRGLPQPVLDRHRAYKHRLQDRKNVSRSPSEIFSSVYRSNAWGGEAGKFHSGGGSAIQEIVRPYTDAVAAYLDKEWSREATVVDLGCGDFEIGQQLVRHCKKYVAVDVVPELINKHRREIAQEQVEFLCLDIVGDALPDGDVCLLRQVLQHLSNDQISKILPKLKKYAAAFITEHYPSRVEGVIYNRDKVCGPTIRLYDSSGVYLDKPPFNIPASALKLWLEVPGHDIGDGRDRGVIRTYLVKWDAIHQSQ